MSTARLGEPNREKIRRGARGQRCSCCSRIRRPLHFRFRRANRSAKPLLDSPGLVMLLGAVNRDRVRLRPRPAPAEIFFANPVRGARPQFTFCRDAPRASRPGATDPTPEIPWRFSFHARAQVTAVCCARRFRARPEPEGWPVLQRRYQTWVPRRRSVGARAAER